MANIASQAAFAVSPSNMNPNNLYWPGGPGTLLADGNLYQTALVIANPGTGPAGVVGTFASPKIISSVTVYSGSGYPALPAGLQLELDGVALVACGSAITTAGYTFSFFPRTATTVGLIWADTNVTASAVSFAEIVINESLPYLSSDFTADVARAFVGGPVVGLAGWSFYPPDASVNDYYLPSGSFIPAICDGDTSYQAAIIARSVAAPEGIVGTFSTPQTINGVTVSGVNPATGYPAISAGLQLELDGVVVATCPSPISSGAGYTFSFSARAVTKIGLKFPNSSLVGALAVSEISVSAASVAPTGTTWDPGLSGSAALAVGNLVTAADGFERGTVSKASGKWYFEINPGENNAHVGVTNASGSTCLMQIADYIGAYATRHGLLLDVAGESLALYSNGSLQGSIPLTISGPFFPYVSGSAGLTGYFVASTYTYPDGFLNWDASATAPASVAADFTADTRRTVTAPASFAANFTADTSRSVIASVAADFSVDTSRVISASFAAGFTVDTLREAYNPFSAALTADTKRQIANSLAGYKALVISLEAKTLSDTFKIDTYNLLAMQQIFSSQINDFQFNCFIDSSDRDEKTGLSSAVAHYDIEQLLYNPIYLGSLAFPSQYTSSYIMGRLVAGLGKSANMLIDSHVPPINFGASLYTYRDLAAMLFGWTSQVPNIKTNLYMRGDTINVIQRGHETGNISLVKFDYAKISQKYVRTLMLGPKYGGVIGGSIIGKKPPKTSGAQYFSGTIGEGDESMSYSDGLTMSERHTSNGVTQVTTYSYSAACPPAYLLQRVQTNPTQQLVTDYSFSGTILQKETETSYKSNGSGGWTQDTVKTTRYVPLGSTFYSIVVEQNDKVISTSITRGIPSGLASAFEIQQDDTRLQGGGGEISPTCTLPGVYLGSGNFPVSDVATMGRIGNAIVELHGSTEERVALKCYDYAVMDFVNTYNWNGNKYFLERNTITYGPKRIEQAVELVRWTSGYLGTPGSPV